MAVLAVPAAYALAASAAPIIGEKGPSMSEKVPQFPNFYDWLRAVPGSFESQLFQCLMIAGTIGMFAHYALKWARGEIKQNIFCYLWRNGRSTLLSFFTFVGLAVGAIVGGTFIGEYGVFVGWKLVFWMGITNGFTIDAIVNKTERARWSPFEREVKKGDVKP